MRNLTTVFVTVALLVVSPTVIAEAKTYKNCAEIHKSFTYGVALSSKSKNKGAGPIHTPKISPSIYKTNKKFDLDKDGIICEVVKKTEVRIPAERPTPLPFPSPVPVPPVSSPSTSPAPLPAPTDSQAPSNSSPESASSSNTGTSPATTSAVENPTSYSPITVGTGSALSSTAVPDGYLAAFGLDATTGTSLFDHPSGLATNGTNLALVDRGNNRVLIWNTAPSSPTQSPDIILCQNNSTSVGSGDSLDMCNWPSDAVFTPTGKFLLADTDNDRILVWNNLPSHSGQAADFAINLGDGSWPWGVWSDGTKVAATLTGKGQMKIWNTFPSTGTVPSDITVTGSTSTCIGTPRGIVSDGQVLMTGDHNGKCGDEKGIHVYRSWPTSNDARPSYMIVPPDSNYAWPMGTFDSSSGYAYLLSRTLQRFETFTSTVPLGTEIARGVQFEGGDGGDVAIAAGKTFVTEYNGNRLAVFDGVPDESSKPIFYLGVSAQPEGGATPENTLKKNFLITNPQVVTLNGSMAVTSDFDRAIFVWKKIPETNGAAPDLTWTTQNQNHPNPLLAMDFQPDSSAVARQGGKDYFAIAGEKSFVVWEGIPTTSNSIPMLNVSHSIGTITFEMHLRVAMDSKHFYLLDGQARKIYVWVGMPEGKSDSPDFTIAAEVNRIRSDGQNLVGTSLYQSPHILIWDVNSLSANSNPSRVGYQMNLPQDALVVGGGLWVADTSFHRVLFWENFLSAVAGSAPTAIIGAGEQVTDLDPDHTASAFRWPASLWIADGYLWVGERKFGHRIMRYQLE